MWRDTRACSPYNAYGDAERESTEVVTDRESAGPGHVVEVGAAIGAIAAYADMGGFRFCREHEPRDPPPGTADYHKQHKHRGTHDQQRSRIEDRRRKRKAQRVARLITQAHKRAVKRNKK